MNKVLYHYTSTYHLPKILGSQYLKLTESNLKPPKSEEDIIAYNNGTLSLYKPVVWMTDIDTTHDDGLGLTGSIVDKTEVKVTIKKQAYFKRWTEWSEKNNINKNWARLLGKNKKPKSWWISEIPVKLNDVLKIENTKTGEIYYQIS